MFNLWDLKKKDENEYGVLSVENFVNKDTMNKYGKKLLISLIVLVLYYVFIYKGLLLKTFNKVNVPMLKKK
jgi:hypothetical protein